jgi:hypothetical protein
MPYCWYLIGTCDFVGTCEKKELREVSHFFQPFGEDTTLSPGPVPGVPGPDIVGPPPKPLSGVVAFVGNPPNPCPVLSALLRKTRPGPGDLTCGFCTVLQVNFSETFSETFQGNRN